MAEQKGLSLTILGIVAVVAILGLVLLFKTAVTGGYASSYGANKLYGGGIAVAGGANEPWTPSWVDATPITSEGNVVTVGGHDETRGITTARSNIKSATWRQAADLTQPCGASGKIEVPYNRIGAYANCAGPNANDQYCCDPIAQRNV